jgi:lipopolysaccharide heptosyltransferase II
MRWASRHLDISEPRERLAVRAADLVLEAGLLPLRLLPARRSTKVRRILLLRLERIGDLLMSVGAIQAVRALAPDAEIDLVIGPWNEAIAQLIPDINRVELLAAPWLARDAPGHRTTDLATRALSWRSRHYDLAINFEGDIRTNLLPWLAGASRRVGFAVGGGGPLLTDVVEHDGGRHVAANSLALVERAFDLPAGALPDERSPEGVRRSRLVIPESARSAARVALTQAAGGQLPESLLAVHVPGGRAIKQWPPARFAEAAAALATDMRAAVVLTGTRDDRVLVDDAAASLQTRGVTVLRLEGGVDLVVLAGMLSLSRLLLTGDTGPMHLAAAVGTPVLAIFGPSMPWRYAPLVEPHRIVRVDLTCSPCNRIRLPPERCRGHVPDCLDQVTTAAVIAAGRELLGSLSGGGASAPRARGPKGPPPQR